MKKEIIFMLFAVLIIRMAKSQDTFSIVAVDSITGEVGSAGASCVNLFLFQTNFPTNDFLGQLIPSVGAINTQARYSPANQNNATNRMNLGETPNQIIEWLIANDVISQPELRQYGIAAIISGSPETAAHTGILTDNYKNHIVGSYYSIQGNILIGQKVLDSMETRFLNEPGDLASKLMAALQGANMIGADTRCSSNGTSSLFAFVKVAQPTDVFGSPSFNVSVRTANNARIEPIDSLQTKFNKVHSPNVTDIPETPNFGKFFLIYPNPSNDILTIDNKTEEIYNLYLIDMRGRFIYSQILKNKKNIDVSKFEAGIYLLKITNEKNSFVKKLIIE